jgi:heme A synthase
MIRLSLVAVAVGLAAGAAIAGAYLEHQSHTYPRPPHRHQPMRVLP